MKTNLNRRSFLAAIPLLGFVSKLRAKMLPESPLWRERWGPPGPFPRFDEIPDTDHPLYGPEYLVWFINGGNRNPTGVRAHRHQLKLWADFVDGEVRYMMERHTFNCPWFTLDRETWTKICLWAI